MRQLKTTAIILFSGILILGAVAPIAAETPDGLDPQAQVREQFLANIPSEAQRADAFGPDVQYTVYLASKFTPRWGQMSYGMSYGYIRPYGSTGGEYGASAQIDLPNGAAISSVQFLVYDDDSAGWVEVSFSAYQAKSFFGDPAEKTYQTISTGLTETPGYTYPTISFDPPLEIHEWGDPDADGGNGNTGYVATVYLTAGATSSNMLVRFWGVVVTWKRTVSPAPATATFNDVPTSHWAFQFVEALVDSGITAGCGGGNYCPDSPVTRAQMAVYLAAALGLHSPV